MIISKVSNPQAGDVHVNAPLTNFSQAWFTAASAESIADIGNCPVFKQSDAYFEWSKEDILRAISVKRAPGKPQSEIIGVDVSATASYYADVYSIKTDIEDLVSLNADAAVGYERGKTDLVSEAMARREETEFASVVMTTGWGTDITPSTLWSAAGSDPVSDVATGIDTIQKNTGRKPNVLIMGYPVLKALMNNSAILDRLGLGGNPSEPRMVTRQALAALFQVDAVKVSTGIANSANPGGAASYDYIVGKHALLAHVPAGNALFTPSAFKRFQWQLPGGAGGRRVLRWREEPRTTWIEGEHAFQSKRTATSLGYFFQSVVS